METKLGAQGSTDGLSDDTTKEKRRGSVAYDPHSVLLFLIGFRLLNALTIQTYFQPDEYFQSLEPAWRMVFGAEGGAWMTWEWEHHLRSAVHPSVFAVLYFVTSKVVAWLQLSPANKAHFMIATPKIAQAICAALGDYYTWQLARRFGGYHSQLSRATLALTICSAWQWFCSTRTLSNCLETTLTISALYLWPFEWALKSTASRRPSDDVQRPQRWDGLHGVARALKSPPEVRSLRRCLTLAALACIFRPTNLLVWLCLSSFVLWHASRRELIVFAREGALSGVTVTILSSFVDRLFYGKWTFPPLRFLYFNIAQSLAVFYGRNDWHYYLSQGLPLLLTAALPFALVGIFNSLRQREGSSSVISQEDIRRAVHVQLATVICFVIAVLSLISHKEVRFIYPLLPILHILAAETVVEFVRPCPPTRTQRRNPQGSRWKTILVAGLLAVNIIIALYTTLVHQAGVVEAIDHLRDRYEQIGVDSAVNATDMTVGFLMPCHSTPWRSHLVHPGIHAWALGCEPPVNMAPTERSKYVDEADRFYADPIGFTRAEGKELTSPSRYRPPLHASSKRTLPDCLVFFEQLEKAMPGVIESFGTHTGKPFTKDSISEWRAFNSNFHDDWRRRGDVVVWCFIENAD